MTACAFGYGSNGQTSHSSPREVYAQHLIAGGTVFDARIASEAKSRLNATGLYSFCPLSIATGTLEQTPRVRQTPQNRHSLLVSHDLSRAGNWRRVSRSSARLTVSETLKSLPLNGLQCREVGHSQQTVLAHPSGARRIAVFGTEVGRAHLSRPIESCWTGYPACRGAIERSQTAQFP